MHIARKPPLKSSSNHKPRVNITFRDLVSPYTDPLGYTLAMANHYRYYGFPLKIRIPKDVAKPKELIRRYLQLNPDLKIRSAHQTRIQRNERKRELRYELCLHYEELKQPLDKKMMGKSNVVLESLSAALEY